MIVKDANYNNCMTLKLYEKERLMVIVSLKYSQSTNELQCEASGSELLNRAKMFVENNVVDKLHVSDDSYIPHTDVFKRIPLKKVKTFITGKSWYEDHGFSYIETERARQAREIMEPLKDSRNFLFRAKETTQDDSLKERLNAYTSSYYSFDKKEKNGRPVWIAKKKREFHPHTLNLLFGTTNITSLKELDEDNLKILEDVLMHLNPSLPTKLEFSRL